MIRFLLALPFIVAGEIFCEVTEVLDDIAARIAGVERDLD